MVCWGLILNQTYLVFTAYICCNFVASYNNDKKRKKKGKEAFVFALWWFVTSVYFLPVWCSYSLNGWWQRTAGLCWTQSNLERTTPTAVPQTPWISRLKGEFQSSVASLKQTTGPLFCGLQVWFRVSLWKLKANNRIKPLCPHSRVWWVRSHITATDNTRVEYCSENVTDDVESEAGDSLMADDAEVVDDERAA